jgi:magnesium chelatase subunit I
MSRSRLLDILRQASPAHRLLQEPAPDLGLAEVTPFPFLAIVGQEEMKLALLLAVVNPDLGGVILVGSRGTAKTTAVRGLLDVLPRVRRSLCPEGLGCTEALIEEGGMDAVCQVCATRFGHGQPLTVDERIRLVQLPLNARLEDVVGRVSERAASEAQRARLEAGILAQADGNILYVDEISLLDAQVADVVLAAAAQGHYSVRRGPLNLTYRARFLLISALNPELGKADAQLLDRFGLRVVVRGLTEEDERYEAYERALWHKRDPESLFSAYASQTAALVAEVAHARTLLPGVTITPSARERGLRLVAQLQVASNRAEFALFEAARAHAAAAGRAEAATEDIDAVALLALRGRRSSALDDFYRRQSEEDDALRAAFGSPATGE